MPNGLFDTLSKVTGHALNYVVDELAGGNTQRNSRNYRRNVTNGEYDLSDILGSGRSNRNRRNPRSTEEALGDLLGVMIVNKNPGGVFGRNGEAKPDQITRQEKIKDTKPDSDISGTGADVSASNTGQDGKPDVNANLNSAPAADLKPVYITSSIVSSGTSMANLIKSNMDAYLQYSENEIYKNLNFVTFDKNNKWVVWQASADKKTIDATIDGKMVQLTSQQFTDMLLAKKLMTGELAILSPDQQKLQSFTEMAKSRDINLTMREVSGADYLRSLNTPPAGVTVPPVSTGTGTSPTTSGPANPAPTGGTPAVDPRIQTLAARIGQLAADYWDRKKSDIGIDGAWKAFTDPYRDANGKVIAGSMPALINSQVDKYLEYCRNQNPPIKPDRSNVNNPFHANSPDQFSMTKFLVNELSKSGVDLAKLEKEMKLADEAKAAAIKIVPQMTGTASTASAGTAATAGAPGRGTTPPANTGTPPAAPARSNTQNLSGRNASASSDARLKLGTRIEDTIYRSYHAHSPASITEFDNLKLAMSKLPATDPTRIAFDAAANAYSRHNPSDAERARMRQGIAGSIDDAQKLQRHIQTAPANAVAQQTRADAHQAEINTNFQRNISSVKLPDSSNLLLGTKYEVIDGLQRLNKQDLAQVRHLIADGKPIPVWDPTPNNQLIDWLNNPNRNNFNLSGRTATDWPRMANAINNIQKYDPAYYGYLQKFAKTGEISPQFVAASNSINSAFAGAITPVGP